MHAVNKNRKKRTKKDHKTHSTQQMILFPIIEI